ncbi:MAG: hypothetical protein HGA84_06085, partial [Syntrophobacteraceae bacterium]|nr:hypothetical protein [Syntrophobacteraceae bacterium]
MNQSAGQLQGNLFYEELIRSFVHAPFFTERPWIAEWVDDKLAADRHRFLLLKAEPGAGKTALMAWLADMHPDWPRYFIRRNSQEPLSSGDARSFLFALGHQLAALRPSLFEPDCLRIVVDQKIEELRTGGRAIGIRVEDLHVSPFYRTALMVRQQVKVLEGELEGLSAKRLVAEPRFLELDNLQHLALFCPAEALLREDSSARIVVLVDALDELRHFLGRDSLMSWLANCPIPPRR